MTASLKGLSIASSIRLASGYDMPRLGFGVYQNYTASVSTLEAFKVGYRLIDTAQAYRNEAQVGDAVRDSGLKREDVFVVTKIVSKKHGYETTLKAVDESLALLKFDYIDLFLIHDPLSGAEKRIATFKALQEAKQAGKIRSVGVSNYNVKHLEEIAKAGYEKPAVNQIELHPLCQQRPIVDYCKAHDIVVQAYCPLLHGNLSNSTFVEIADKYKRDPSQILLRWSLQRGFVPLPKSATTSRILSNAQLYDFELSGNDMQILDALDRGKEGSVSWNPVDAE